MFFEDAENVEMQIYDRRKFIRIIIKSLTMIFVKKDPTATYVYVYVYVIQQFYFNLKLMKYII